MATSRQKEILYEIGKMEHADKISIRFGTGESISAYFHGMDLSSGLAILNYREIFSDTNGREEIGDLRQAHLAGIRHIESPNGWIDTRRFLKGADLATAIKVYAFRRDHFNKNK